MKSIALTFFYILTFICIGCSSTQTTIDGKKKKHEKSDLVGQEMTIINRLSQNPTITVDGYGQDAVIRVRGGNGSIFMGSEPLFIVDDTIMYGGWKDVYTMVNPMEIDSIKVLKNAGDTSMYGLRGSNGVIIIKLKKGEISKTKK